MAVCAICKGKTAKYWPKMMNSDLVWKRVNRFLSVVLLKIGISFCRNWTRSDVNTIGLRWNWNKHGRNCTLNPILCPAFVRRRNERLKIPQKVRKYPTGNWPFSGKNAVPSKLLTIGWLQSWRIWHNLCIIKQYRSMEEQNSGKATLEEMARLRVQLEQSSSESQSERQELESLVQRLRSENARLERELRLIEQGRRNREPMEDIESRDRGNDRIQENDRNVRADNQIGHKVRLVHENIENFPNPAHQWQNYSKSAWPSDAAIRSSNSSKFQQWRSCAEQTFHGCDGHCQQPCGWQ